MSSMYPVSGAFSVFGTRFVSPALGFTLGKESKFAQCILEDSDASASRLELLVTMVICRRCIDMNQLGI